MAQPEVPWKEHVKAMKAPARSAEDVRMWASESPMPGDVVGNHQKPTEGWAFSLLRSIF